MNIWNQTISLDKLSEIVIIIIAIIFVFYLSIRYITDTIRENNEDDSDEFNEEEDGWD